MSVKVREIYHLVDMIAPFEMADDWDNVGLLAGSMDAEIDTVLCALDLNPGVLDEAEAIGAGLIVTHHPILFRGRKNLREDDAEGKMLCRLVRDGISLIAAHTNYDNADPGVNNALAELLEMDDVKAYPDGMRIGVPKQNTLGELTEFISQKIGAPVRCYGEADHAVHSLALLGGAGEDFCGQAIESGADVYLTGEVAHHKAWDAYLNGLCVLEGGHAATELPGIEMLTRKLNEKASDAGYAVRFCVSEYKLFR